MTDKTKLLGAIAGTNRGLLAKESDRLAILSAIAQLEENNPTARPTEASDRLEGNWRLLYTTSNSLLNIDRPPFVKLGQIYQCIRPQTGKLYNIAEVSGLPYLDAVVSVAAKIEAVSERRVDVKFQRWFVGLQSLLGYQSPGQFVQQIEAGKQLLALELGIDNGDRYNWLDTTYLDDDLRIGRGSNGSVYVLTKV